jgi:hypothetical protein
MPLAPLYRIHQAQSGDLFQEGDTTMFTRSAIALALIVGITSSALAATTQPRQTPNAAWDGASAAFAATKRQHSPNPAWDVYDTSGQYVGSDPDPNVRMQLQSDHGY